MKKRIIFVVILFCMNLFLFLDKGIATAASEEKISVIDYIPEEGQRYLKDNYVNILECAAEDEFSLDEISDIRIGTPYVEFVLGEVQDSIYHYPLIWTIK